MEVLLSVTTRHVDPGHVAMADVAAADAVDLEGGGATDLEVAGADAAHPHRAADAGQAGIAGADRADPDVATRTFQLEVAGTDAADLDVAADVARLDVARADRQHLQRAGAGALDAARANLGGHRAASAAQARIARGDIDAGGTAAVEEGVARADHQLHQHVVRHGARELHPAMGTARQVQARGRSTGG